MKTERREKSRTQTEALCCCDDWYVRDKIPVLEKLRNQMQI